MKFVLSGIFAITICITLSCQAQEPVAQPDRSTSTQQASPSSTAGKIINFPTRLFNKLQGKAASLDQRLTRQTEKYLRKFTKTEARLRKEMVKKDSNAAKNLFAGNPEEEYAMLIMKMKTDTSRLSKPQGGAYQPYADSLQGALMFLNKNPGMTWTAGSTGSLAQLQQLQAKMQDAGQVRQIVEARKAQIQAYLAQYAQLPGSLTAIYNDYNKQLYYYTSQIQQYKDMLNDPDKMTRTALALLDKNPAFTTFMQSNSFLSGLFAVPPDYGSAASVAGLQTRDQVLAMIQGVISTGGPNGMAAFSQNLQSAQGQLQALKDKLPSLGSGGQNMDNPNFKPNNQKTKTFLQRLQVGTNIQTTQGNHFFPTTTDLGLSLGYKLTDKQIVGIGASYKFGWGSDIRHIKMSSQGVGLRSFMDAQMMQGLYISGGFEYNYQQPFNSLQLFRDLSSWQQSGLVGLSKIVAVKTKTFKQTKIQLLWDFLSYQQVPRTQPFKFRIGYNF